MTRSKKEPPAPAGGYGQIWAVVARIPPGRVATYGQVAALAGKPGHARQAGYAMHALPEGSGVPWHRVINARGEISPRTEAGWAEGWQRHLLEEEGVAFDARGRIDLARFGWDPDPRPRARRARRPRASGPAARPGRQARRRS
jgi:methylated-DNA-protein-cysteine methyltransferase-like protein